MGLVKFLDFGPCGKPISSKSTKSSLFPEGDSLRQTQHINKESARTDPEGNGVVMIEDSGPKGGHLSQSEADPKY